MYNDPDLSSLARARLIEQIADIIREFEEPYGSEEYPTEAAERIIALVLASHAPT